MTFQDAVKTSLAEYKKDVLNISEQGEFKYRGRVLKYDHILPTKLAHLNILESYRGAFYDSDYSKINYHRYFHHLNSSQALCINLFFPLIAENRLDLIIELLGIKALDSIFSAEFEHESTFEISNSRKTNFDFYVKHSNNQNVFFEIKYTESGFGKARHDIEHKKKFNDTYQLLLNDNQFISDKYKKWDIFLNNYQIMRNLVHINEISSVVFVIPESNAKVYRQSVQAFNEILTAKGQDRLRVLSIESIVDFIVKNVGNSKVLTTHYNQFKRKYLAFSS